MIKPINYGGSVKVETVAEILERELQPLIEAWLVRVEKEPNLLHRVSASSFTLILAKATHNPFGVPRTCFF
jgi:hypothetical protein